MGLEPRNKHILELARKAQIATDIAQFGQKKCIEPRIFHEHRIAVHISQVRQVQVAYRIFGNVEETVHLFEYRQVDNGSIRDGEGPCVVERWESNIAGTAVVRDRQLVRDGEEVDKRDGAGMIVAGDAQPVDVTVAVIEAGDIGYGCVGDVYYRAQVSLFGPAVGT